MRNIFKYTLYGLRSRLSNIRTKKALERQRASIVNEAVDHLVDGIDPKIRFVSGYKKKLWREVDKALIYIDWLVDTIPGPVEFNRNAFATNPLVNAVFATVGDLQRTFSQSDALRAFFDDAMNVNVETCYALMCMEKKEHAGFGMELVGDVVKRDVPRITVNFSTHSILSPATTEKEVRRSLKRCIFDALISNTFESVIAHHLREGGTDEYRKLLDRRYKANQAWGQELTDLILSIRADAVGSDAVPADVESAKEENHTQNYHIDTPADHLERILEILSHPEDMVRLNHISINLTRMGIKVKDNSKQTYNKIQLTELMINNTWRRIIVLVKYPRNEMLSKDDFF